MYTCKRSCRVFLPFIISKRFIFIQGPVTIPVTSRETERINDRSYGFSEQVGHWDLPMHEGGVVMSTAVGPGKDPLFSYTSVSAPTKHADKSRSFKLQSNPPGKVVI